MRTLVLTKNIGSMTFLKFIWCSFFSFDQTITSEFEGWRTNVSTFLNFLWQNTHFPALTTEWTHSHKSLFLLSVHSYIMCILMSADLKKCAVILSPSLNFGKLCTYFIGQLDLPSFTPIQNEVRSFKGDIHHHHHHTPETSYTPGAAALSRPRSCNRLIRNVSLI